MPGADRLLYDRPLAHIERRLPGQQVQGMVAASRGRKDLRRGRRLLHTMADAVPKRVRRRAQMHGL